MYNLEYLYMIKYIKYKNKYINLCQSELIGGKGSKSGKGSKGKSRKNSKKFNHWTLYYNINYFITL